MAGEFSLNPIFFGEYLVSYSKTTGVSGNNLRVYKYFETIGYLGPINENRKVDESLPPRLFAYSLVYFNDDFGMVLKAAGLATVWRGLLPTPTLNTCYLDPNPYFSSDRIADLTLIQRREDPITDTDYTTI